MTTITKIDVPADVPSAYSLRYEGRAPSCSRLRHGGRSPDSADVIVGDAVIEVTIALSLADDGHVSDDEAEAFDDDTEDH